MIINTRWIKEVYRRIRYCGESAMICVGPDGCFIGGSTDFDSITYFTPMMTINIPFACRVPFSALESGLQRLQFPKDDWSLFHRYMKPFYYSQDFSSMTYNMLRGLWTFEDYIWVPADVFVPALRKATEIAKAGIFDDQYDYSQIGLYAKDAKLVLQANNGYQRYQWSYRITGYSNYENGTIGAAQAQLLCKWLKTVAPERSIGILIRQKGLVIKTAERLLRVRLKKNPFPWQRTSYFGPALIGMAYFYGLQLNEMHPQSQLCLEIKKQSGGFITEWLKNKKRRRYFAEDSFCVEDLEIAFPYNAIEPFLPFPADKLVRLEIYNDDTYTVQLTVQNESCSVCLPIVLQPGVTVF